MDSSDIELSRLENNLARCEQDRADERHGEAISMKLRSLLAGLCVSRGEKNGRAYEIEIPDNVYGMLTTGGFLKYHRRGDKIVVRYEPAAITVESKEPQESMKRLVSDMRFANEVLEAGEWL